MKLPQTRLLSSDLAKLVAVSGEQATHLTELNWWAVDGGIENDVTEGQVITLMRHQAALTGMILTLVNGRAKRKQALPRPTFVAIPHRQDTID